jgi:NADH:ubiquinone oxidoreductase subunit
MSLKIIFTWWNKQTFGTFLKTLFFGKFVGSDEYGNKYYQSKKNERWVVYANVLKQLKLLQNGIYGCIIRLIKFQFKMNNKYLWQKKHLENQTGTKNSFKPVKLKK